MENLNLVLGTSHVLQGRKQNYVAVKRLLTVHSEDRDTNRWPNASSFEIELPEAITNVQSMGIVDVILPQNMYVFSRASQNTKMFVQIGPAVQLLEIQEGTYTPEDLASELKCRLRKLVGLSSADVMYDKVGLRFWFSFGDVSQPVAFRFDIPAHYSSPYPSSPAMELPQPPQCTQSCAANESDPSRPMFARPTKWGLGWYLGFSDKEAVNAAPASHPITFGWKDPSGCAPWIDAQQLYIAAPCPAATRILGETAFYIEIDNYNMYDELSVHGENVPSRFSVTGGGSVNSAFAKVAFTSAFGTRIIDPDQQGFQNIQQFEPPLERIRKLRFRMRYHDGRLVDFKGAPFDMTLVFIQLRDEIERKYAVRVPPLYK